MEEKGASQESSLLSPCFRYKSNLDMFKLMGMSWLRWRQETGIRQADRQSRVSKRPEGAGRRHRMGLRTSSTATGGKEERTATDSDHSVVW